jgi:hypothetical protein
MLALDDEQACRVLGTPLAQFARCDQRAQRRSTGFRSHGRELSFRD